MAADWREVSVRMPSAITFEPGDGAHGLTQSLSGDTKVVTFQQYSQYSQSTQVTLIR
jgi:hypothetical protein